MKVLGINRYYIGERNLGEVRFFGSKLPMKMVVVDTITSFSPVRGHTTAGGMSDCNFENIENIDMTRALLYFPFTIEPSTGLK